MIFLDIETASHPKWLARKAKAEGAADWAAYALEHAGDGALSPWSGIVTCWSVIGPQGAVTRTTEPDAERAALIGLARELLHTGPIVTHNGAAFDWPFLRVRALACGIPELTAELWQPKPWAGRLIDTAAPDWSPRPPTATKGWSYSLDAWAELLGIERPEQLPGSECPAAWYRGEYDRIAHHCADDVRVLREVYMRLAEGRAA